MGEMENCFICKKPAEIKELHRISGDNRYDVKCHICGRYEVARFYALTALASDKPNDVLSAIVRNKYENGEKIDLSEENAEHIMSSVTVPKDPLEAIDHLLDYIFRKGGKRPGSSVRFEPSFAYPILFAKSKDEFEYLMAKATELKYIEIGPDGVGYRISIPGWQRLSELRKTKRESNQAFVAMWFDASLDKVWDLGFKKALEITRFDPLRIDLTEHNEKICDQIVAEIRRSELVIADVTGQRGGVYFEAGFAMGLGIPVIWSCSKEDIDNVHFDTRQYNHIVWDNAEDLKTKLVNRIEATIPGRAL